jgi:two-component system response regulator Irr
VAEIIVVDDELELLDVICEVIRDDGHSVRGASNAEEALVLFWQRPADLIVADVLMPNFPVDYLLRGLRELEVAPHMIILSGAEEAILQPYSQFLVLRKPFEYLLLREKIGQLLTIDGDSWIAASS